MKLFSKFINFVKKSFRKFVEMFRDKNPAEVVNDVAKTVTAVTTAAIAIYAGVNAIRVHLIPSIKKNKTSNVSAHDIIFENRNGGSIDEKISILKKNSSNIGKKNVTNIKSEDLKILESIAKTRNSFFQTLSPEEQLNVLEMEEFDFKGYVKDQKKKSKFSLFKRGSKLKSLGHSDPEKPFREPVNYGIFNFILQPIDDFIHWIKNDPIPKRIPQIQVVDHPEIPNIPCETALDLVSAARNLDSYLSRNKIVSNEIVVASPEDLEEQQILADEIFRHKTLSKFKKAVNMRMAQSNFNSPNIFDLMDGKKDSDKKKKKKKKKSSSGYDSFSFIEDEPKKKKKNMSKDDQKAESLADKRAKELYRYHLEKAMGGEFDRKGFGFDF